MPIQFRAYRVFKSARIEAIDSTLGLVVSARITSSELQRLGPAVRRLYLPEIYPQIQNVQNVNLTGDEVVQLMADVEMPLAHLGIGYLLSAYQVYGDATVALLRDAGVDSSTTPKSFQLGPLQDHLANVGVTVKAVTTELFGFVRRVRNAVMHDAGLEGSLSAAYGGMSKQSRTRWEKLAWRPFPFLGPDEQLQVEFGELVAAFAVLNRMADEVSDEIGRLVPGRFWAEMARDEYVHENPALWAAKDKTLRKKAINGVVRLRYGRTSVTTADVASVV
jgi:hypothetical protein